MNEDQFKRLLNHIDRYREELKIIRIRLFWVVWFLCFISIQLFFWKQIMGN